MVCGPTELLSPREREVAERIARGEALKVIAAAYSLSIQAVSTYIHRAKRKLGVTSRSQLTRAMLSRAPAARSRPAAGAARFDGALTPAESNVLAWLLRGLRNADIAQTHHISTRTVDAHTAAIMRKVGVRSRAQLIAMCLRPGDFARDARGV